MKYLDVNLTKYVQDLNADNYKILIKEVKDDWNKWKKTHSCIRQYIMNMSIFSKLICRFNSTLIKIIGKYFVDIDKIILKFIWNHFSAFWLRLSVKFILKGKTRIAKALFKDKKRRNQYTWFKDLSYKFSFWDCYYWWNNRHNLSPEWADSLVR